MDEDVVDALMIGDVEVVSLASVVERISLDHPGVTTERIRAILLREWEAFSAGVPLVVPLAVEAGAREVLGER